MSHKGNFKRLTLVATIATLVMLTVGLMMVYLGSRMVGGIDGYGQLLKSAAPAFLVWRLLMYALLVLAWMGQLRKRVVRWLKEDADGGAESLARLHRLECAVVMLSVVVEVYNLYAAWGHT